jgi:uncharacterized iron-regulated protein
MLKAELIQRCVKKMTLFLQSKLPSYAKILANERQSFQTKKVFFYFLPFTFYLLILTLPAFAETVKNSCPPKLVVTAPPTNLDTIFPDWDKTCGKPENFISSPQQMLLELAKADVVYLGETHDSSIDHQNQLKIIQELQQRHPKIAIAMEMFQRPYQGVVDQYLAGKLTEQELTEKSEYEKRWGFPWENYAPILRFAKAKQLPVLALNTPSEVTRQVARQGLESLTPSQKQFIPPFAEIRTDNEKYRQLALQAFQQHQDAGHGNSADAERFFLAQVLWDETMAEGIAKFVKANPDYQVVVLAGQGHIIYGYGIPSRVKRRLEGKKLIQRSVLLSPPEEATAGKEGKAADFIFEKTK